MLTQHSGSQPGQPSVRRATKHISLLRWWKAARATQPCSARRASVKMETSAGRPQNGYAFPRRLGSAGPCDSRASASVWVAGQRWHWEHSQVERGRAPGPGPWGKPAICLSSAFWVSGCGEERQGAFQPEAQGQRLTCRGCCSGGPDRCSGAGAEVRAELRSDWGHRVDSPAARQLMTPEKETHRPSSDTRHWETWGERFLPASHAWVPCP